MKNVITPEQQKLIDNIESWRKVKDNNKAQMHKLELLIIEADMNIRTLRQQLGTLQREQEGQKKELSYKPKITQEEALSILNKYSEEEYKRCRDIYFK